jgi:hypothetical protein
MSSPDETRRKKAGLLAFLAFYFGVMALIIALEFYRNFQAGGGWAW